jgi:hypothetical protein
MALAWGDPQPVILPLFNASQLRIEEQAWPIPRRIERVEQFMLNSSYWAALGVRAIRPASSGRETTMVHHGQNHDRPIPVPSKTTRRTVFGWTAKFAAGALAAVIPTGYAMQTARADDDEVILIAGGAQVSARPGSATARSSAAEAVATRGAARVQAAAALAEADSDEGAITQGAAASTVAIPDQGATAQSASAVASASSEDDVAETPQAAPQVARVVAPAPSGGGRGRRARAGGGRRARGGGTRVRGGRRAARAAAGGERIRRRDRAASLPSAGVGHLDSNSLPSLFTIASAAAALGAVVLRDRSETAQVAEVVANNG